MRRSFIPVKDIQIYDEMHYRTEDGWDVDEALDGQSKEKHVEGIEYIKGLIRKGAKIRPILVMEKPSGGYERLDGFKRCIAHIEENQTYIEAFICTESQVAKREAVKYLDGEMWCGKGGQPKEVYKSALDGYDMEDFDYGKIDFLYKNDEKPHGLRIEACENIQVHWGEYGRYRLAMGRRDFIHLAEAISSID